MEKYFVRISPGLSGMHLVHKESCPFVPDNGNRILLGRFSVCKDALRVAREYFQRVDGCYFCNKECYESKESNEDYCWLQINSN